MKNYYGIIYKATNKVNGKSYIGQTVKPLKSRITEHRSAARYYRDGCHFHNSIRKYGIESFVWEVLCKCESVEDLNYTEILFIEKFNTFNNGYNLTTGGYGSPGIKGEKNSKYGKKVSNETRQKMSESQTGKKLSEETKSKISNAKKGKTLSNNHKTKIKISMNKAAKKGKESYMYGKKLSRETRLKMSESHKGIEFSEERKNNISLALIGKRKSKTHIENMIKTRGLEWLITYPDGNIQTAVNLRKFCRENSLDRSGMLRVSKSLQKQYKGYKCKKLNEYIIRRI